MNTMRKQFEEWAAPLGLLTGAVYDASTDSYDTSSGAQRIYLAFQAGVEGAFKNEKTELKRIASIWLKALADQLRDVSVMVANGGQAEKIDRELHRIISALADGAESPMTVGIEPSEMDEFDDYEPGMINGNGGGNVEWWRDYMRSEIDKANDHWRSQLHQFLEQNDIDLIAELSPDEVHKLADELYAAGYNDRENGRDYDPRARLEWADVSAAIYQAYAAPTAVNHGRPILSLINPKNRPGYAVVTVFIGSRECTQVVYSKAMIFSRADELRRVFENVRHLINEDVVAEARQAQPTPLHGPHGSIAFDADGKPHNCCGDPGDCNRPCEDKNHE